MELPIHQPRHAVEAFHATRVCKVVRDSHGDIADNAGSGIGHCRKCTTDLDKAGLIELSHGTQREKALLAVEELLLYKRVAQQFLKLAGPPVASEVFR